VDGILAHLDRVDDQARDAALAVGEQYRLHGGEPEVGDGDDAIQAGAAGPLDQDELGDDMEEAPEGAPTGLLQIEDMDTPAPDAGAPTAAPSVDELFARIRAGAAAADDAPKTDPGPVTGAAAGSGAGSTTPGAPEAAAGPEATATGDATAPADPQASTQAIPVAEAAPAAGEPERPPGPDDPLIARRDELLGPVTARLSRTVKRTLGDDQNRLLDRIRSGPSLTVEELLGPEDEQLALFASAVRAQLAEAFAAGTTFAGAGAAVPDGDAVDRSSSGLSRVVVTMLRRRIGEGSEDVGDRIGAAFREWRGERVDRLAGDYATQAFSAGVTAAGTDGKLRWVVTSSAGCSDCADNELAGAVSAHESFPTGHLHPPAHSGCRCLVAPTDS
jgi:hypothetical protein